MIRPIIPLQPSLGRTKPQLLLDVVEVATRLGVATTTLKSWLVDDQDRPASDRVFEFHRWRGRNRKWTEEGFLQLESAIHRESQSGVLARWRSRDKSKPESPADPDAAAALLEVLGQNRNKTY